MIHSKIDATTIENLQGSRPAPAINNLDLGIEALGRALCPPPKWDVAVDSPVPFLADDDDSLVLRRGTRP